MKRSLSEIYVEIESKNSELTYDEYLLVINALELKNKAGLLNESIEQETDLVYWIETLRKNNNLNEWTVQDFTNLVKKVKEEAKKTGKKMLLKATSILEKFKKMFSVTFDAFIQLGKDLKLDMKEVFETLKEKGLFEAVKTAKKLVINTVSNLYAVYSTAYKEASIIIFGTIDRTKIGEYLEQGTLKIQQLVEKYPKLKYILGPIIAYTLYYIWTQMVFKGDFLYDFDWSANFKALLGDFDVVELFSGPGGIELLTWFALGLSGMFPSAAWLDGDLASLFKGWGNHALAILVTMMIFLYEKYPKLFERPLIKAIQKKLCDRERKLTIKKQAVKHLKKLAIRKRIYRPCKGPKCNNL